MKARSRSDDRLLSWRLSCRGALGALALRCVLASQPASQPGGSAGWHAARPGAARAATTILGDPQQLLSAHRLVQRDLAGENGQRNRRRRWQAHGHQPQQGAAVDDGTPAASSATTGSWRANCRTAWRHATARRGIGFSRGRFPLELEAGERNQHEERMRQHAHRGLQGRHGAFERGALEQSAPPPPCSPCMKTAATPSRRGKNDMLSAHSHKVHSSAGGMCQSDRRWARRQAAGAAGTKVLAGGLPPLRCCGVCLAGTRPHVTAVCLSPRRRLRA